MKNLTIKSRLFFAIVAILVCSYSLLFFTSYISIQQFTEDEISKDLQTALKFAKTEFGERPEIVLESLKMPVSSPPVQGWFKQRDMEKLRDAVNRWNRSLDFLEMLTLVDGRQNVLVRNGLRGEAKSFVQGYLLNSLFSRRQPFITTELVSRDQYCMEVHADVCQALPDNKDVMVQLIFVPVISSDGSIVGAVVAGDAINKDPHLTYQQQKVFGKTVEMLITQMGERIASTMPAANGLAQNLDMKVIQTLKGGYTFSGATEFNNRSYDMIAEPIQNHKGEFIGSIAVALETAMFSSLRHENFRNLILCGLLSIPFIFVLAYFTARQFSLPIRRLTDAVRCIEFGDITTRVPEKGVGEFHVLYETFNHMADTFAEREVFMVKQNEELAKHNAKLESQVEELSGQLKSDAELDRAILKSLLDGILVTDSSHTVIRINPMAEKLLGICASKSEGRPVTQICTELYLTELAERIASVPEQWPNDSEPVLSLSHAGRKLRISINQLLDGKDCFKGLLLGIRDVSREGEVDRLKSDFIATVSHELKTPLTSMKGSLQFILKKGKWLTGVEREMLGVCLRNTERLISLIGSILEISRIEAGQIPFAKKPVSMGELALYALEEVKGLALSRNISFVNGINFDLPRVQGDYDRLHQVLSNLLSNAVKFSPTDSVVVLMAERLGNYLAVSVSDDGKVINPADRDRLFSKFQQFSPPEDGEPGGSGLGLAISREIVEKHGGTIHYTPGLAGGNIFTFTVPLYGEDDGQG
ncbi:MAG TPA: ATP-binding protein [Geobacteraceae bacterium]|nr:ATP-binding protein [Geobacteraceae bacterium]